MLPAATPPPPSTTGKSHVSTLRRAWLTATVLFQLLIILFLNWTSNNRPPPPSSVHRHQFQSTTTADAAAPPHHDDKTCKYGRVYIYDLPAMLNKDLVDNCHHLEPWASRCSAVSNAGFGPPATNLGGVVPENLIPEWSWTDMYAGEVIFHNRMTNHRCRTVNPDNATAFYIPFYVGLAVGKYLWFNYTSKDRDFHSVEMLKWVKNQDPFRNSNGSDHFIFLGRLTWDFRRLTDDDNEWGTKFLYMPLMKNVLRLGLERSPWDEMEISIPYPTPFHPRSESDIRQWQSFIRGRKRVYPFSFVGATRKNIPNDFRGVLINYCKNEPGSCRLFDCSVTNCFIGAPDIWKAFLDSDFCLQPKGDGSTRRSTFDCLVAGSIPVFFWRGSYEDQYEWHLPGNARTYSVFIDNKDVRNDSSIIKRVLENYSKEEVRKMRETIVEFLPRLLYSRSNTDLGSVCDAFDVAVEGVLKRFKQRKISI